MMKHFNTIFNLYEPKFTENITVDMNKAQALKNFSSFNNLGDNPEDFGMFFRGFCRAECRINIKKIKKQVFLYFKKLLKIFEMVKVIHLELFRIF